MSRLNDLRINDWVTTIEPTVWYYGQIIGIGNEFVRVRWICVGQQVRTKWSAPDEIRKVSPLELLGYQAVE